MATQPVARMTLEEYLANEDAAELPSEYLEGEVFPMEGASPNHARVLRNLIVALAPIATRGQGELLPTARVKIEATGLYTYPDILITCGEIRYLDSKKTTILNPRIIFEVASPATAKYDEGWKFWHYRQIPSLAEYILASQDKPIMVYSKRLPDGKWLSTDLQGSGQTLHLELLETELPIGRAYEGVQPV